MLQFTEPEIFGTGWNRSLPGWLDKVGMASTPSPILQFTEAEIFGTGWNRSLPGWADKVGMASTPSLMLQFTAAEIFGTGWNRSLPGVEEQGNDGFHAVPNIAIYGGRNIWDRVEPIPTGVGKVMMASTPSLLLQFTKAHLKRTWPIWTK
jgi:hypothetical protein